jgi:hypothetical protein
MQILRRPIRNHWKQALDRLNLSFLAIVGIAISADAATITLNPVSDAFVATGPTGNLSDNNYGGGGALAIGASGLPNGEFQSVMMFDLSSARNSLDSQYGVGQWSILSVGLQLSSSPHNNAIYNNISPGLFSISLMQNNSWTEGTGNASNPGSSGITFNALRNLFVNNSLDQALGTFQFSGGSSGANQYSLGLTPGLLGDVTSGTGLSLRLFAADNDVSYLFSSRSASAALQPELIITAVPEPGTLALTGMSLGLLLSRRGKRRHHA